MTLYVEMTSLHYKITFKDQNAQYISKW